MCKNKVFLSDNVLYFCVFYMYINGVKECLKLESKKKIVIIGVGFGGLVVGMLLS